jgi:hypothetical protein
MSSTTNEGAPDGMPGLMPADQPLEHEAAQPMMLPDVSTGMSQLNDLHSVFVAFKQAAAQLRRAAPEAQVP